MFSVAKSGIHVAFRVSREEVEVLARIAKEYGFKNRSQTFRDLVRAGGSCFKSMLKLQQGSNQLYIRYFS